MSRKHILKRNKIKRPVKRIVLQPEIVSKDREAREVPKGTDGAIAVKQDDGSTKYFVVGFKVVKPAIVTYRAQGSTIDMTVPKQKR